MIKYVESDSWMFETFRILNKHKKYPKEVTESEKERLRELGIET